MADCIARVVEAAAMEEHEAAVSALERPGEEGLKRLCEAVSRV